MGMLGYALASGIKAGTDSAADSLGKQMVAEMEQRKAEAIADYAANRRLADEETMNQRGEARLKDKMDRVKTAAGASATAEQQARLPDAMSRYEGNPEAQAAVAKAYDGFQSTPTLEDISQARVTELGEDPKGLLSLQEARATHAATREDRQADNERRDAAQQELERHNRALEGRYGGAGGAKSSLDKLPEGTKIQVMSALRVNEKLETELTKLDPSKFESQAEYDKRYAAIEEKISANNGKINTLLGGKEEPTKHDLFPPKGKPADAGGAPAPKPVVTPEAETKLSNYSIWASGNMARLEKEEAAGTISAKDKLVLEQYRKTKGKTGLFGEILPDRE